MKFRFFVSIVTALTVCFHAEASHIVGGEFQIIHINNYSYQISLAIYFDEINGNPAAEDVQVVARIFRAVDGSVMGDVTLPLTSRSNLNSTIISCSVGELRTRRIIYSTIYTLSPESFNDPGGYYIAWERCCRNYNITNIYSENPQVGTRYAGQTFFLHFPPVRVNGSSFINSSPELFPAFSDYACVGRKLVADFSAKDRDGDLLKYSIVTALSTHTANAIPQQIQPKPYPLVSYRPGFSEQNMIGGLSSVKIDNNGILSVTSDKQGLFAFAVKCEEFRNGLKIGEVIREYQLLVMDNCSPAVAPTIEAKAIGGIYTTKSVDVYFNESVPAEERCIFVRVKDADNFLKPDENVSLRATAIDFQGNISGILPDVRSTHLTSADASAEFKICFDDFPRQTHRDNYELAIIAYDETCSTGLSDTVKIVLTLDFDDPPEAPPVRSDQWIFFYDIGQRTIGDQPFLLSAVSTSGLPVTFSSDNPAIASVSTSVITMHQPGRVTITAMQLGDEKYVEATPIKQSFCVMPMPPSLSVSRTNGDEVILSSAANNVWLRNGAQVGGNGNTVAVEGALSTYTALSIAGGCYSKPAEPILITSLAEPQNANVNVYPNPVSQTLSFSVDKTIEEGEIELTDLSGRCVVSKIFVDDSSLDVSTLDPGVYLLRVRVGKAVKVFKIQKR